MVNWLHPEKIRSIIGITQDIASDEDLVDYIEMAKKLCIDEIAIKITGEKCSVDSGTIKLMNAYIADKNFDGIVNKDDVVVYTYTNENDPSTKVNLTVIAVYPNEGIIKINESGYTTVYVDYYHYTSSVDLEVAQLACAFLVAFYYSVAEISLLPTSLSHGALRFKLPEAPERFRNMYIEIRSYAISGGSMTSLVDRFNDYEIFRSELS